MSQNIQNGLYILSPKNEPDIALTLTQKFGENEYSLLFQEKDPKNDYQKFYFRKNKE